MSDTADLKIAALEDEVHRLRAEVFTHSKRASIAEKALQDIEKRLVERDVYEAQQVLPPEQAALIKHLATVERCIEEGPVAYSYAESSNCSFCDEWQTGAHKRDCDWLVLQFLRKPEKTMEMVHEHALNEHAYWLSRPLREQQANALRTLWPQPQMIGLHTMLEQEEALVAARRAEAEAAVERSRLALNEMPASLRLLRRLTSPEPQHAVVLTEVAAPDDDKVP